MRLTRVCPFPAVHSKLGVLCQKVDPQYSEGDRVLPAGEWDATPRSACRLCRCQLLSLALTAVCRPFCQQSQLTHYPERKIAEFQLKIESLEKEYKRFIAKLRVLDPSCKQKPWTPRSYSKRRADTLIHPPSVGQSQPLILF